MKISSVFSFQLSTEIIFQLFIFQSSYYCRDHFKLFYKTWRRNHQGFLVSHFEYSISTRLLLAPGRAHFPVDVRMYVVVLVPAHVWRRSKRASFVIFCSSKRLLDLICEAVCFCVVSSLLYWQTTLALGLA